MATVRDLRPATRPLQRIAERVVAHSVDILRACLGLLIAGFGALKFFRGASPAQPLVTRAVDLLTFGVITGHYAVPDGNNRFVLLPAERDSTSSPACSCSFGAGDT
jgi:hypothetical protein